MSKRLIIMRHAKSSRKDPTLIDHQRPLNGRGRRTAPLVGAFLKQLKWDPDYVLSSDSTRTSQTWERLSTMLDTDVETHFTKTLYLGGARDVMAELAAVSNHYDTVLMLGHNPTWEDIASRLSGQYIVMKTADCVLLESNCNTWEDAALSPNEWFLERIVVARELDA